MSRDILFLGPRFKNDYKVGGVVILFEDLLTYSDKNKINYYCIDTNLSNYQNKFLGLINILFKIFTNITKVNHVSLHGTASDFIFLAPFVILFSKLFHKKVSLRKFAGSFYDVYQNANFIKKVIIKFVLFRSDFNFFETKLLIDKFQNFNKNTFWWPNSRNDSFLKKNSKFDKRFVFISQVKKTKGILEFIKVAETLGDNFTFDVFGPVLENNIKEILSRSKKVNYKGVLESNQVAKTLVGYDVLILPTYHDGEGYPGIVIECFSCGIPVISTDWNSIPEIVEDNVNGFLVPIKNVKKLRKSILKFTDKNYSKFSKNSVKSFNKFNSKSVNKKFFDIISSYPS